MCNPCLEIGFSTNHMPFKAWLSVDILVKFVSNHPLFYLLLLGSWFLGERVVASDEPEPVSTKFECFEAEICVLGPGQLFNRVVGSIPERRNHICPILVGSPVLQGYAARSTGEPFPKYLVGDAGRQMLSIVICVFLIFVLLTLWILMIFLKEPLVLRLGSKQTKLLMTLFYLCLIFLIFALAWLGLEGIKRRLNENLRESLQTVLDGSMTALTRWAEIKGNHLTLIATDPDLVATVSEAMKMHLQTPDNQVPLGKIRQYFRARQHFLREWEFLVIAPDGTIFDMMGSNQSGKINPIKKYRPKFMERALKGESILIPPIPSDVKKGGTKKEGEIQLPPTLFFAAPIKDNEGRVIAVLTQRLDPQGQFSRITQLGRIGETGKTYLFDQEGRMVSESRFPDQLEKSRLVTPGGQSILAVSIRNPGGNLMKGYKPIVPRDKQPLTLMAASAVAGNSGFNVEGYPDYRGVSVVGVWTWNPSLGMGMTTEIDVSEGMILYKRIRLIMISSLGVSLLMVMVFTGFNLYMEGRTLSLRMANQQLEEKDRERAADLVKKESHFKSIVTNLPGAVYRCLMDEYWTVIYVSNHIEVLTGYPPSDFINNQVRAFADIIHPADTKKVEQGVQDCVKKNKPYVLEYRIITRTGKVIWVHEQGRAKKTGVDVVEYLDGFMMDITQGKQAEIALERSRKKTAQALKKVEDYDEYRQKVKELEQFNDIMLDREIRVVGLKREVNELASRLGESSHYPEIWNDEG